MDSLFLFLPIILFVVISIVEESLSLSWSPGYFGAGLPILRFRYALKKQVDLDEAAAELSRSFSGEMGETPLVFRVITPDLIAFRENMLADRPVYFRLPKVLHSALRVDSQAGKITLTGYLNWWVLALLVFTPVIAVLGSFYWFTPIGAIVILLIFVVYPLIRAVAQHRLIGQEAEAVFNQA